MKNILLLHFILSSCLSFGQRIGIVSGADTLVTDYQAYNKSKDVLMTSAGYIPVEDVDHILLLQNTNNLVTDKFDELGISYSNFNGSVKGAVPVKTKKVSPYGNFTLIERDIFYQNVFNTPGLSAVEIEQKLLSKFPSLKFKEENYKIDYRKYGATLFGTSAPISDGEHFFDVLIQVKDGRYRVTTSNHLFITSINYAETIFAISENDNSKTSLEEVYIKRNGELRTGDGYKQVFKLFSQSLDDYFGNLDPVNDLVNDDDW